LKIFPSIQAKHKQTAAVLPSDTPLLTGTVRSQDELQRIATAPSSPCTRRTGAPHHPLANSQLGQAISGVNLLSWWYTITAPGLKPWLFLSYVNQDYTWWKHDDPGSKPLRVSLKSYTTCQTWKVGPLHCS